MNYYNEIKQELINNETYKKVKDYSKNRNDLETYYNVGKLLVEAQGGEQRANYGDNLIKEYSEKLMKEIGKGYNVTSLKRMRKLYIIVLKGAKLSPLLMWSHYVELLKLENINIINYYIDITIKQNLSVRELRNKIKSKEYERLDDKTKYKLMVQDKENIEDFIKNPILIKNSYKDIISEKLLKQLILEDMDNFLSELGEGFSYIKNEYKIKLGDRYNYIDFDVNPV